MKYLAKVTKHMVYQAEVEVEADNEEDAKDKAFQQAFEGELWDDGETYRHEIDLEVIDDADYDGC